MDTSARVIDYYNGEELGIPTDVLLRASLEASYSGAVSAVRTADDLWEYVPETEVQRRKSRGETVYTVFVDTDMLRCECGSWSGERCPSFAKRTLMRTIEYIPEYLRETHRQAGNPGQYPMNGAALLFVTPECAARMIEADPEWVHIQEK